MKLLARGWSFPAGFPGCSLQTRVGKACRALPPPLLFPWGWHLAPLVILADLFNIVQLQAGRKHGSLPAEPQLGVSVGELRLAVRHAQAVFDPV